MTEERVHGFDSSGAEHPFHVSPEMSRADTAEAPFHQVLLETPLERKAGAGGVAHLFPQVAIWKRAR